MSDKGIFTGPSSEGVWSTCFISLNLRKRYVIREDYNNSPFIESWDKDTLIAPECLGAWKNT